MASQTKPPKPIQAKQDLELNDNRGKQAVIVDYKTIACESPGSSSNAKPFIQYTLEWLLIEKFDEIYICCLPENASQLRKFVELFLRTENVPKSMVIQVHTSENNRSTGDCLRDLDSKGLMRSDFVIMDVGCCGNLPAAELPDAHRALRKIDMNVGDQLWSPECLANVNQTEVKLFLELSASPCLVPAGIERGLYLLHDCAGNIKLALERLLNERHPQELWTKEKRDKFIQLMRVHGKNFQIISRELIMTPSQCIQHYYTTKRPRSLCSSGPETSVTSIGSSSSNNSSTTSDAGGPINFPCRVCGRVFEKIKSRSAHMKRHKNERG